MQKMAGIRSRKFKIREKRWAESQWNLGVYYWQYVDGHAVLPVRVFVMQRQFKRFNNLKIKNYVKEKNC